MISPGRRQRKATTRETYSETKKEETDVAADGSYLLVFKPLVLRVVAELTKDK